MRMNPNIIMAGQQPDFANALAGGVQAGQAVRQAQQQNALAELFKTQGAGIMSGDQQALNALAQISPDAALGIMGQRQQMDARAQDMQFGARRLEVLNAEEARRVEEYAATKTAAERAAEAAQIEDAVKQGMLIQTPEQWDQVMATQAPDLVGQFGNRDALAGKYMTMAEILKQQRPDPAAVTQGAPTGFMWVDPNDRAKGVSPIAGYQANSDLTADQKDYQFYAKQELEANRKPLSFNEWSLQSKRAGATTVNVGSGATPQETAKFNSDVKAENVNQVIEDIKKTNADAWMPTTGFAGEILSNVGGTAAGDIRSNLETLKAAASFGSLQAMRAASPTGAALGAVSDTEIKMLSAELAALEQSQSQEQFLRNLERFQNTYNQIVNGPQAGNSPGNAPKSGNRLRFNPETGDFE